VSECYEGLELGVTLPSASPPAMIATGYTAHAWHMRDLPRVACHWNLCAVVEWARLCGRYVLDNVADNNRRYLVDRHIQAAAAVEALLDAP